MKTPEQRREKARLRSERWRRAHEIMQRRPAQRPWLAEGVSRSTWYRRRKRAREQAAAALAATVREAVFDASTGNLHDCGVSLKRPRGLLPSGRRSSPSWPLSARPRAWQAVQGAGNGSVRMSQAA